MTETVIVENVDEKALLTLMELAPELNIHIHRLPHGEPVADNITKGTGNFKNIEELRILQSNKLSDASSIRRQWER